MIQRCIMWSMVALLSGFTISEQPARAQSAPKLSRSDLLEYVDPAGQFLPVRAPQDWEIRRSAILRAMQEIMGPLPGKEKRCGLEPEIEEKTDCGDYIRRLITYQSEPGCRVPAFLLIPKVALMEGAHPVRAVLCLHPTNNVLGHRVVVGFGEKENRAYAAELAQRGLVTIAPAYPLLADYQPNLKALGYESGTMKAIWDNIRAIDLLETLPFVRRGGVAAIGHSLGGHNAIYTAVFEPRIKVVVSSCGFDAYSDYFSDVPDVWNAGKGWTQERYMPRLAAFRGRIDEIPFDFPEIIGSLAPRPVFVNAPIGDSNFKWQSVDRVVTSAQQVYGLFGAKDRLVSEHPQCAHDFPEDVRERAYQFIIRHLQ